MMKLQKDKRCGLYVHVPFCSQKCLYCGFYSEPVDQFNVSGTVSAIIEEIDGYSGLTPSTIYIGGGSPSCLPIGEIRRLVEKVSGLLYRKSAQAGISGVSSEAEFTVEVNPSQVSVELLKALIDGGVNRLSIGAQSFIDDELKMLGRNHRAKQIIQAVEFARDAGFENISLDLIFALPGSSNHTWMNSLNSAVLCDVEHISAYSLTYEKGTPLFIAKENGQVDWVDEEIERQMYAECIEALRAAGYKQYEVSNFARAGFECEHNMGYWRNWEYVGVGPGASSHLNCKRFTNIPDISKYIQAVESGQNTVAESVEVSKEDAACEGMVLGLRMIEGVNLKEFAECTGYNAEEVFSEAISGHIRGGMLEEIDGRIRLTQKGLFVADRVLCDFASM